MKSPEEFKIQADKLNIENWPTRACSICGYPMEYVFIGGNVFYDSGCDCTSRMCLEPRTWHDIAYRYNSQQDAEVIKEFDRFWGFDHV